MVFVDERVAGLTRFLDDLAPNVEYRWVTASDHGLAQVSAALTDRRGLRSLAFIAHGRPGVLQLGRDALTCETLAEFGFAAAAIRRALAVDGDVQIYGCEVGRGAVGRDFVAALSEAFCAPVATSSTLVGHADNGGDWRLDVGEIRTPPLAIRQWRGLLALKVTPVAATFPDHASGEFQNSAAFAALRSDGSVVTWGDADSGGDSRAVGPRLDGMNDVTQVFSNWYAFSALRADGSLVTWGDPLTGGDSSALVTKLDGTIDVTKVFSSSQAFAALRADGSLVTWGDGFSGGDSGPVAATLDGTVDVIDVYSTYYAFAALRDDGSVVTWGSAFSGGDSSAVAAKLDGAIDVTSVFASGHAFAALRSDGSVVTWGFAAAGGDASNVATELNGTISVIEVFSTDVAFAALRADGSVVTWGGLIGDTSAIAAQLDGTIDVTTVFSTNAAFAALRADGSLVTWGFAMAGADTSAVASKLDGSIDVIKVTPALDAFAALRADGSVVTWGDPADGGDSSAVAAQLDGTVDVIEVFSNDVSFAALRADGSIVTWGSPGGGGDSTAVADKLDGTVDVIRVFSTWNAFAALRVDGSVVTWGNPLVGGDSDAVASQLSNVVWLATPFTNDVYGSVAAITGSPGVDQLVGTSGEDSIAGFGGDDRLEGLAGNDTLDGGSGADTMTGGDGNDFYYVDHAGDVVSETSAAGGSDLVFTTIASYTLGAHVENARILASGAANLTGNSLNNLLYAGIGNNFLNGSTGSDTVTWVSGVSGATGVTASLLSGTASGSGTDTLIGIEHLVGSANADRLTGDGNANNLSGGLGNDTLDGGAGADTMTGGDGNDFYYVDHAGDVVSETSAAGGSDLVFTTVASYTLGAHVENARILASGAANLTGNSLNNLLYAGIGNNVLNGSTGSDTVTWVSGVSGATGVTASLATGTASGSGTDTLIGIEHLVGSANADRLTGDGNANNLSGGLGNDTLDGGGGADTMTGGDGNDFYYVDHAGDVVSETSAAAGVDLVFTTIASYTLGAHVENARILASGAANLTGNSLNNLLYAGVGNNVLNGSTGSDAVTWVSGVSGATGVTASLLSGTASGSGTDTLIGIEHLVGSANADRLTGDGNANNLSGGLGNDTLDGGAGADTMTGGDGNDFYYVDHAGDIVSETSAAAGTDLVFTTIASYTLGAHVENARILASGTANLTGNTLNNLLYAGVGNNVLNGSTGSDTVTWVSGVSGATGVTASLLTGTASGSGTDTLVGIEHLVGSANADRLTGDGNANSLSGGAGNDTLDGGAGADTVAGGLGNDSLTGGSGADIFRFDNLPDAATNRDTISDFNVVDDTIQLENAIFTSLASPGTLAAGSFRFGAAVTAAADADDYLIYNSSSGALYYDAGGNAGAGPVQIATLANGLALSNLDFLVT